MEKTRVIGPPETSLLDQLKDAKIPLVPLSREELERVGNERLARARLAEIQSGVVPASGRGSCGGTTPLPNGRSWRPHTGRRQRQRHLKQIWSRFEKLCRRDEWAAATRERLLDLAVGAPDSETAAMVFASIGLTAAEKTGESWVTALNHVLNELEQARDAAEAAKVAAQEKVVDEA